ncbi:MAG: SDR family oxidoreductase [Acholeplasmataceae bacterium]|nr:SDR family oxidoreductase [Acholeplasmataceae bacterium]
MGIIQTLFGHILKNNMKTIVLTGATSGIGLEVAKELLKQGHRVISSARNMHKAENIKSELIKSTKNDAIEFFKTDFADFESVTHFANQISEKYDAIDILINNAGTWEVTFKETVNGIETNLQVNHLSPMLLTLKLIPFLQKPKNARIINTSSGAHRRDILNFDNLEFRQGQYNGVATYSQSKLLNILFSLELSERLKQTNITVNTVHPGYVQTSLFDKMGARDWSGIPSAGFGAQSTLYAALSPDMEGVSGKYIFINNDDNNLSNLAQDKSIAKRAWDSSMAYIKNYI